MAAANVTTDHEFIREWAESRGGKPVQVRGTGGDDAAGIIRIDFPGYSGAGTLEPISWEQWFEKFEESDLALIFQEETAAGEQSNFNKLIRRPEDHVRATKEASDASPHADESGRRVVRVVPARGDAPGWVVMEGTHDLRHFETKKEAVQFAREQAKEHERGQLVVHKANGRIQYESTYGADPVVSPG